MSRKEIRQKKKSEIQVRKALLISALSTMMCLAMLLGTTFAWFTDTAATSVNTVSAGNLKLELEYAYAAEDGTGTWSQELKATESLFRDVAASEKDSKWYPGLAKYVQLKVKNDGDLSLKYRLGLIVQSEGTGTNTSNQSIKLSETLKAGILDGAQNFDSSAKAIEAVAGDGSNPLVPAKKLSEGCITGGNLYPDQKNAEGTEGINNRPNEKIITIVVYYPTENAAETSVSSQDSAPDISIGVRVFAGQLADESDSDGDSYDKNAPLETASTEAELTKAIEDALPGDTIALTGDISITKELEINKKLTIDLNGKTVSVTGKDTDFVTVDKGGKLTITGKGTVTSENYVFRVKGGEVIVEDGDFTAQETVCALFGGSKLIVNGGAFTSKDNNVVATNGSSVEGCEIDIKGGVFNANIETAGFIACGVYVANKDTVNINAGTFNVTDGVGVLMRAGHTTIGADVIINLTNTGKITAGKVGDANIDITTPSYLVMDVRSGYPGATEGFTITNNSSYNIVEYKKNAE